MELGCLINATFLSRPTLFLYESVPKDGPGKRIETVLISPKPERVNSFHEIRIFWKQGTRQTLIIYELAAFKIQTLLRSVNIATLGCTLTELDSMRTWEDPAGDSVLLSVFGLAILSVPTATTAIPTTTDII